MHPDAIIAALKKELEEAPERRDDIEKEIARVDKLPRPTVVAEEPAKVFDRTRAYLDALKHELHEAVEDRRDEIHAEIKRVESRLHDESENPRAERASRRVSRATNKPEAEQATADPERTTT